MAETAAFNFVCNELENGSSLDRLEARGTVRLALKQAGLEARSISPAQMSVVVDKVLPAELVARGIEEAPDLCSRIKAGLASVDAGDSGDTPDAVFERLGGSA